MAVTGTVLGDRYRLLDVLGEGGMAVVYRARDELLDRDVAIKVLRDQYASDDEFVRRFRQEARNAASLSHPNIVPVFDTGIDDGVQYIVMQLVEGRDLEGLLAERGRLPVAEALRIATSAADALAAAHARGIVHRDVKPGNILLSNDGEVHVVDFGIARALGDSRTTQAGLLLGSVQYCSPEQVLGEPVGTASDVFSLGVVLYELLTGMRPWNGPSPASIALARLHDRPAPPSRVAPDLPAGLDEIVMRALERDPQKRYGSAEAIADAIRDWWRAHRRSLAAASAAASSVGPALPRPARAPALTRPVPAVAAIARSGPGALASVPAARADRRRSPVPWLLPLLALMLVTAAGIAWLGASRGGGGVLDATASPRVGPSLVAVASASATLSVTPAPTPSPATPSPTATPTASPTPSPTPVPTPRPTPRPTPTPPPAPATAGPARVVAEFYDLVERHEFDAAAALWTPALRERYPPDQYIAGRFAPTTRIDVNRDQVVAIDERAGTATVAVNLTEYRSNGEIRHWVGSWGMVRTASGWLMNDPNF